MIIWMQRRPPASPYLASFFRRTLHESPDVGFPVRMRGDYGMENAQIKDAIIEARGAENVPYPGGRSVHDQRIERLRRDVRVKVFNVGPIPSSR